MAKNYNTAPFDRKNDEEQIQIFIAYLNILKKNIFEVKFFRASELLVFILTIPLLIAAALWRELKKGRLGDSLKRTFIKNA